LSRCQAGSARRFCPDLQGVPASDDLFMALCLDPSALVGQANAGEWWRLGTATFLNASLLHLTLNSWALAFVGAEAEAVMG
jgi:membrane associated rhomboid family serine protease